MQFKSSAPGSLMLLGEYGVLHGKYALVCAVDKRITVTLVPRQDDRIEIRSAEQGSYSTKLSTLNVEKPFQFVLQVLKHLRPKLKYGCELSIESEFSDKIGLGSSAAVTVATFSTLMSWLKIKVPRLELIRQSRKVVRTVQGVGSGADIAASVCGGIVGYQTQPLFAEKFNIIAPLNAFYAGFKTPTVKAISHVQSHFASHPDLLRHIANSIGQCALDAMPFLKSENWAKVGELMNIQQGLMEALGVNMPLLREMIEDLRKQNSIFGAKISGSGLGDCVIGLGELPAHYQMAGAKHGVKHIPIQLTLQGVQCEKS